MPPAILIAVDGATQKTWYDGFRAQAQGRDLRFWPDEIGDPREVEYACGWRAPHGLFAQFPNLKALINLGAGVDHMMADKALPDIPLARAVHPDLTMRMTEWVVLHVLIHHRRQRTYDAQQREKIWLGHLQPAASDVTVGVMGMGEIGTDSAEVLGRIGFQVAGWSRTPKTIPGIAVFHGQDGLDAFLKRTEILVCLLPHTPATEGILRLPLFAKLKRDGALGGAYVVNGGRGKLQIDADIIAALDQGLLAGVSLDVFPVEPLPPESPMWSHPKVVLTPHNAGDLTPRQLIASVLAQIDRAARGEPLQHLVDRRRGY